MCFPARGTAAQVSYIADVLEGNGGTRDPAFTWDVECRAFGRWHAIFSYRYADVTTPPEQRNAIRHQFDRHRAGTVPSIPLVL
mgnify:FL=1